MSNDTSPGAAIPVPLFDLGEVGITPGALAAIKAHDVEPLGEGLLKRHVCGDWTEMSPHDRERNMFALRAGLRIFSSFQLTENITIWIITEADRSSTTFLLPDEY